MADGDFVVPKTSNIPLNEIKSGKLPPILTTRRIDA